MSSFFITGTDTNVGKTVTAGIITQAIQGCYWKPIQSGVPDSETVREFIDLPANRFLPSQYSFHASLSPDQAAALEGVIINPLTCKMPESPYPIIVEGAGGVFTPINPETSMMDLMLQLALPVIIVARGTVGTINHTLLTIEALIQRKIAIKGIVFCGDLNHANQITIKEWGGVETLFHIPHFENITKKSVQEWLAKNQHQIKESLL